MPSRRSSPVRLPLLALLACTVLGSAPPGGLRSLEGTELGDLLERFDRAQQAMEALEARFRETRDSGLFDEPVVLSGRLLMEKPNRVLWAYREPEERYFLLEGSVLTAWYPRDRLAERQDLRRSGRRLRRMVGLGESSEDLLRNNDVSLLARSEVPEAREMVLVPRNRRLRKHVPEVRLWVDEATALPVQVRYTQASGDRVTIRLTETRPNAAIPEESWALPIPPGTPVRSELSSLGPFSTQE